MFKTKTLIVLGAGASQEVGMPTGKQLRAHIASMLDSRFEYGLRQISGDDLIYEAIRRHAASGESLAADPNRYREAGIRISEAMPQAISIDNFIESHSGDKLIELCGKLGIAQAILNAESNSRLWFNEPNGVTKPNYSMIESTWFTSFMQLLTESCRRDDLKKRLESITFINFNYDRCLEHFLYHGLQTYYSLPTTVAAELVSGVHIYHPYGSVGLLPWMSRDGAVAFGGRLDSTRLLQQAKLIKTFTEGTDEESSDIQVIR